MTLIPTDFAPFDLDGSSFEALEPLIRALLTRPVLNLAELEKWILDRSELSAAASESRANLYIAMTCDTDDTAARDAYLAYVEQVAPKLTPLFFELDRRLVELSKKFEPDPSRYAVLIRGARADVELFREENIALETQLAVLSQQYEQITGAMTVQFDGQEQTLPRMARYQEGTDRAVREAAWRAVTARRLQDAEAINVVYDEMVKLRHQVALNAGFPNFVPYAYKSKHRFDYAPKHCEDFHAACETAVVPLVRALERERASLLGVSELRPWDLAVDVKGRAPLRPFTDGRDLIAKCRATFDRLDPRLSEMFRQLGDGSEPGGGRGGSCLDLDSRKGKAPGGYQYMRDRSRRPFIFMNAAGLQRDLETLFHEAGHAFHSMLCKDEPLVEYRGAPTEFSEVASMAMELLAMPHWMGTVYTDEDSFRRACRQNLKHSILLLPWVAQIDAFQHWVYSNPLHTREQRTRRWLELDQRLGGIASWAGIEEARAQLWQRQLHLFGMPFYYIEYGIARLGAMQLWLHSLERGERSALDAYVKGLSLGGSKPLPELFAASGLTFDFGPDTVKRLVDRAAKELDKLPE
ncbi:MAG: M3 family oligoendopeptidase [Planctomycetes bacterium]|nr:M3 family oligoendopeptidase [Planctomycetota bacterium]